MKKGKRRIWESYERALARLRTRLLAQESARSDALRVGVRSADPADTAESLEERDDLLAEIQHEDAELSEVEAALERIRSGTFGVCEATGRPIPTARLRAIPWTRFTVEAASERELEKGGAMTAELFPQLVFSAEGFTARPDAVAHAEAKAIALHRRTHLKVGVVRVRVSRESPHIGPSHFVATAIAHGSAGECVAHGTASEPIPAIDEAFRKLLRALTSVADAQIEARPEPRDGSSLGEQPLKRKATNPTD